MNNAYNLKLYGFYAPRYERLFGWLYARPQRRAVALLNVQPGERVFVPGVGTGMGLAALPADAQVTAIDLSPAMLAQAQRKLAGRAVTFEVMDAQHLRYPDGSFDAALLSLILSVVPDGAAAFREAWRVLRPGGRAVIFDKFLPEAGRLSPLRRAVGAAMRSRHRPEPPPERTHRGCAGLGDGAGRAQPAPRAVSDRVLAQAALTGRWGPAIVSGATQ